MGMPGHALHTALGPETALGDRWTDHPTRRIEVVSACAQTGMGGIRLGEAGRRRSQVEVSGSGPQPDVGRADDSHNLDRLVRLAQSPA